ncbi:MAG: metallophosphoesterase [Myxococcota bacterium]
MRITHIESKPFRRLRFINAGKRGKRESAALPISMGRVDELPDGLDALVVASDLQGVCPLGNGETELLGVALANELVALSEEGLLPYPERTGVVLAGDLYAAPAGNVRGATGDVREVWERFADSHRWVLGVQGNHDTYGTQRDEAHLSSREGIHLLDAELASVDSIQWGGVGRIIGDPKKIGRRSEADFLAALDLVLEDTPDVLVLHQGPRGGSGQRGCDLVRARVDQAKPPLVIAGHVHWASPLAELPSGTQLLNVDGRVVIFR